MIRHNKFIYTALAILTLGISSCSDTPAPIEETPDGIHKMEFLCHYPGTTKATETSFESGDGIGVFVAESSKPLEVSGNVVNNELFKSNGTSWNATKPVYWNDGKYDVFAYYPYQADVNSISDFDIEVQADQRGSLPGGMSAYEASDILYAQNKGIEGSNSPVPLQFKHILSKLTIRLLKGENYEGDIPSSAEIKILNTVTTATLDLEYGIATKNPKGKTRTILARQSSPTTYSAILIPQRLDNRSPLIEVIMNGVSYLYESKFQFKAGTQHIVNLVIDTNPEQLKIEIGGEISNDQGWK